LKIIKKITPGIPKNPAIKAVQILTPILKLKYAPKKLTINSKITPKTPFNISFIINFMDNANNFPNKKSAIMASKK
jgi:hypothetical protein